MTIPMLFSPLQIRGLTLKNRVVVAPMHQYSAVEGFATDWHLVNAGRFAQGGAGLVIMHNARADNPALAANRRPACHCCGRIDNGPPGCCALARASSSRWR